MPTQFHVLVIDGEQPRMWVTWAMDISALASSFYIHSHLLIGKHHDLTNVKSSLGDVLG